MASLRYHHDWEKQNLFWVQELKGKDAKHYRHFPGDESSSRQDSPEENSIS